MKCCIKCNIEKDDGDFIKDRNVCKICYKQYKKQYYQNNAEAIKEYKKQYRQNNAEVIKEKNKQYYQNNAEVIKEKNKQYHQNNAEAIKEYKKQYRQNNAEAIRERDKQYYQNNAEVIKEKKKQYRQNNAEAIRERQKQYYQNNAEVIKERWKQYHENNAEAIRERQKQYRRNNVQKTMLRAARERAKQKNLPFNINEEDLVIPSICPVLGIPLEVGTGKGSPQPNSPTLDRIIPERGYIKNNVIVISHRANTIKNNATADELMKVALAVKKLEEQVK